MCECLLEAYERTEVSETPLCRVEVHTTYKLTTGSDRVDAVPSRWDWANAEQAGYEDVTFPWSPGEEQL
jgi:hypothetical protein